MTDTRFTELTDLAVQRWATAETPRMAELMTGLVRHLHDYAREVNLTEPEWMAAIQWLTKTGQISDEKREEFILASDVLGLSMLVVQLNHDFDPAATPATVLGPFHIDGSPAAPYGFDMSEGIAGRPTVRHRHRYRHPRQGPARRHPGRLAGRRRRHCTRPRSAKQTRHGSAPSTKPAPTAPTACAR